MKTKIFSEYNTSASALEVRITQILSDHSLPGEKERWLFKIPGIIDLTTLEGSDTTEKVKELCRKARFSLANGKFDDAAAICVYPSLVRTAAEELKGTGIRIASVAGAFPSGQSGLHVKLREIEYAISEGADEIDTVISRGKLIEGLESEVFDELSAIRETCGSVHLKVILETGELPSVALIRKASELAILAGADFIKTSTGKIGTGATPPAFLIMLDSIREYLEKTGKAVGIKAAGGIRTTEQALVYAFLLLDTLGEQWFNKNYFRIGASSLADEFMAMA